LCLHSVSTITSKSPLFLLLSFFPFWEDKSVRAHIRVWILKKKEPKQL
jgi:hypothetical protein